MAKIMRDYSKMPLPKPIERSNPVPLDCTELFYSLEDAVTYASTDPLAYVGQTIKVVDEENSKAYSYTIQDEHGTLEEVGAVDLSGYATKEFANSISSDLNTKLLDYIKSIIVEGCNITAEKGDGSKTLMSTTFVGTLEEYKKANQEGKIPVGTIVYITDDESDESETTSVLGVAVLGKMILG